MLELAPAIEIIEYSDENTVFLIDTTTFPESLVEERHKLLATPKRRIEKAASDYLLRRYLDDPEVFLLNDDAGKPFCTQFKGDISLTHSKNKVAIQFSKSFICGIDIQIIEERIKRLASKFLNNNELLFINSTPENEQAELITKCWCIKEVVYKTLGAGFHDYHEGFRIRPFTIKDEIIICDIETEGIADSYKIKISRLGDFALAYRIG